jgi:outer membrane protein TolC
VEQVESQLAAVRSRFEANTVTRSDVLKVEVQLAQAREALSMAASALDLALAVLENVMGVRLDGRRLPEVLPPAPWTEHMNLVEEMVAEALAARPEVGEVSNRQAAAEQRVRAAQAGKYPTLGFVADYDAYGGQVRGDQSYFIGLAGSINLFDAGRTGSNVRQAEAQLRELNARQQRILLDIELEVRRASLQVKDARERLKLTSAVVPSAEANLRQVESRFRQQSASTTELLEAQVMLTDARVRAGVAEADVEVARAALERATGRLSPLLQACPGER